MRIGVPRERKDKEFRVGVVPDGLSGRAARLLAANELPAAPKPATRAKPASERSAAGPVAAPPAPRPAVVPAPPAAESVEKKPGFFARLFGKK